VVSSDCLRFSKSVRFFTDSDGGIAIDRSAKSTNRKVQLLGGPAATAAILCDGTRGKSEVLKLVSAALNAENALNSETKAARHTASGWISKAIKSGVLEQVCGRSKIQKPTVTELRKLVEELYEQDNVEAAFRCQRQLLKVRPKNADDWYLFGDLAHATGRYDISREAYLRYLADNPEDTEIKHLIVALGGGEVPGRVPDASVARIFDGFAESFDDVLLNQLNYQAPVLVARGLKKYIPKPAAQLRIADLGCGTGLAGKELDKWSAHMCGVDLSAKMAARACETGVYQEIHIAEIHDWLKKQRNSFDIVMAADVFVYLGDLSRVFKAVRKKLAGSGHFAFTVEKSNSEGFQLTVSGRYAHHRDYIREVAETEGMRVLKLSEVTLREEYGENVRGYIAVLAHT